MSNTPTTVAATEAQSCPPQQDRGVSFGIFGGFDYPWGQDTTSCNIANLALDMQNNISSDIIQTNTSSQGNSFVVTADCTSNCDTFVFAGNVVDQNSTVNMANVQRAYVSNTAQQQLLLQMLQSASAVSKGLGILPQDTQALNMIGAYIRLSNNMTTNITQSCAASQNNVIQIQTENVNNVVIANNVFDQTATSSIDCNQAAINRNQSMQSLTVQLSQLAEAESDGLSFWFLMIIIIVGGVVLATGEAGVLYAAGTNPSSMVLLVGVGLIAIALLVFLMMYLFWTDTVAPTYGCSPTIPKSTCASEYVVSQERTRYSNADAADKACKKMYKKDRQCTAYDWEYSGDANAGYATFYKGGPKNPVRECTDITGLGDVDDSPNILAARPCAFVNDTNLKKGVPPDNSLVADVVLNTATGELWVKMPPGFDTCNPPPITSPIWSSSSWTFVKPSVLEASNSNTVWIRPATTTSNPCSSVTCSSCPFETAVVPADGARVYLYIHPDQNIDLDLQPGQDSPWNFGTKNYKGWLTGEDTQLPGYSGWDFNSAVGSGNISVKDGDYFLVPFPYGPTNTQDPTVWPGTGDTPASSNDFEFYAFGAQFYLYKAVRDSTSGAWLPYSGYAPNDDSAMPPEPPNRISGYGVFPIVKPYITTGFRFETRYPEFGWATIICGGIGLVLVLVGAIMSSQTGQKIGVGGAQSENVTPVQASPMPSAGSSTPTTVQPSSMTSSRTPSSTTVQPSSMTSSRTPSSATVAPYSIASSRTPAIDKFGMWPPTVTGSLQ